MHKIIKERVNCPKCGSDTYAWGKNPLYRHLQRYRCKNLNCKHQFTPNAPKRSKKYPTVTCPKRGSKMSIFKFLSYGYRLRCNNHIHKDHRHCNHKINVPLPCNSFKIAKDPFECIETQLSVKFSWNKISFSTLCVSYAIYSAIFKSIPATDVSAIMKEFFHIDISHNTITRWTHKASLNIHKNLGLLSVPKTQGIRRTLTDETVFRGRGNKRWVWMTKESRFDSERSWFISTKRYTEYARSNFNVAFTSSPALKNIQALTDDIWSYSRVLADINFNMSKHKVYKSFFENPNNNRRERSWANLKLTQKIIVNLNPTLDCGLLS